MTDKDGKWSIGHHITEPERREIAICLKAVDGISSSALSSGVVGEMVEAVEVFKEFYDADVAIEWDVFWPKIQSILSKLEANNG